MKITTLSFLFFSITIFSNAQPPSSGYTYSLEEYKRQTQEDAKKLKKICPCIMGACLVNAIISGILCPHNTPLCVATDCVLTTTELALAECADKYINRAPTLQNSSLSKDIFKTE